METPHRQATIKDVAKAVGMSVSTASAILNGRPGFSQKTCRRVWDAAHDLNYQPNARARMLRNGDLPDSRLNTHILMHVSHQGNNIFACDRFEAERALMLDQAAQSRGHFLTHYWYHQIQGFQCPLLLDRLVDGVLLGCPHQEIINTLRDKVPTVLMDIYISPRQAGLPVVNMDLPGGWRRLLAFAVGQGHRSAFVVRTPDYTRLFERGLSEAIKATGLEVASKNDIYVELEKGTHYPKLWQVAQQVARAVRTMQTSLLLVPNLTAARTLRDMLLNLEVRIPDDLAILTVNFQSWMDGEFACVNYDWPALVSTSMDTLLSWLANRRPENLELTIPPFISPGMMFRTPSRVE